MLRISLEGAFNTSEYVKHRFKSLAASEGQKRNRLCVMTHWLHSFVGCSDDAVMSSFGCAH